MESSCNRIAPTRLLGRYFDVSIKSKKILWTLFSLATVTAGPRITAAIAIAAVQLEVPKHSTSLRPYCKAGKPHAFQSDSRSTAGTLKLEYRKKQPEIGKKRATYGLPGRSRSLHNHILRWGIFPDVRDPRVPLGRYLCRIVLVLRQVHPAMTACCKLNKHETAAVQAEH